MNTYRYESPGGIPLAVEVPKGQKPPKVVVEQGCQYFGPVEECADIAAIRKEIGGFTTATTRPSLRTRQIAPMSLPLNWPFAPAHAKGIKGIKDGTPLFTSQREIDEAQARAQHAGEDMVYDD